MAGQPLRGWARLRRAWVCSRSGLRSAIVREEAFRLEVGAAALLLPASLWLGENGTERALLVAVLLLVLLVELLNSGIEAVVDRIGSEHHELSGRAKDLGSAAVLLALLLVPVVWGLVLLPHWL
jgi:diacylglycerol kinase (ATP)